MARKSKPQKTTFNPISYLKSGNARKLPMHECLIPKSWQEDKKFPILFSRKHVNGNLTFVSVLVDLLCTGAKDVLFFVNEPDFIYHEILETYEENLLVEFVPVNYELIHNIIFESVAFAEEYGIAPHEDFRFVEMILEEDTDDFPRIDVPLGENGKAHLHLNEGDDRIKYFEHQILKYGKEGTYEIFYHDHEGVFDDDFEDDEEFEDYLMNSCLFWEEEDWEDYYENIDLEDLPIDIVYHIIPRLPDYDYEKMKQEKLFAPFTKIQSTDKPTSKSDYSKREREKMHEIFELLQDWDAIDTEPNPSIINKIENEIKQSPNNRILLQYKWEYFHRIQADEKTIEIALEMKRKFPDYLFGLTCHAQTLIELEKVDEIPDAMNNLHKLQDLDPKRKKFHTTELLAFYSPWIYYYSMTGQIRAAFFLMRLLIELEVLGDISLHPMVLEAYRKATSKIVSAYLSKVKSGYVSKGDFIERMMN